MVIFQKFGEKLKAKPVLRMALVSMAAAVFCACAAPAQNLKCKEIKTRLEYQNLSADQRRFAEQDLKDCEAEAKKAVRQDSSTLQKFENRLSPQEDSL